MLLGSSDTGKVVKSHVLFLRRRVNCNIPFSHHLILVEIECDFLKEYIVFIIFCLIFCFNGSVWKLLSEVQK